MAITANGTTISFDGSVPQDLLSISGPTFTVSTIDVTSMDSTRREFTNGQYDSGEISFEIAYNPGAGTHQALVTDIDSSTAASVWFITFSDNSTCTGTGFITAFSSSGSLDDKLTASVTVKCTDTILYLEAP